MSGRLFRAKAVILAPFACALPLIAGSALGPRYGGELTVGVLESPANLEPRSPRSAAERLVAGLVHETLAGIGPDSLPTPALISAWSVAGGGREWTLTLREGLRSHGDQEISATDAVRSLRRFLRTGSPAAHALAGDLEGGRAFLAGEREDLPSLRDPDSLHVVLRLSDPGSLPLAPLASPAAAITDAGGRGCGPFVPTVNVPGTRIGLTAFSGHVRGRPYLDRVQVAATASAESLREELAAGRVDLAPGEVGVSAVAATLLLILDPSRPPFDRTEARAAAATAIDRADLVRHLIPGGDPSPLLLVPPLLPPLVEEALRPQRTTLTGPLALAVGRDVPPLVSQRIVAYLSTLGLQVRASPVSPASVSTAPAAARLILWSPEVPEAGLALRELAAMDSGAADVGPPLDAAARELEPGRRRSHLYRAEAALRAHGVLVPLASVPVSVGSTGRRLRGVKVNLAGRVVLEDAWMEP